MEEHRGMRPQDVAILLKMVAMQNDNIYLKAIAQALSLRETEVTHSVRRSAQAGLLEDNKRVVVKQALLEFFEHGLKYVFPQQPGKMVKGVATGRQVWSKRAPGKNAATYVWPYKKGKDMGLAIRPLHVNVPASVLKDPDLHRLFALADTLRMGDEKERSQALAELKRILK